MKTTLSGRLHAHLPKLQVVFSIVLLLFVWWAVTASNIVSALYLPSPAAVWDAFVDANTCHPIAEGSARIVCGSQEYFLWQHLLMSLFRIAVGLVAAVAAGVLIGFVLGMMPIVNRIVSPYINFLRMLPPLGYIGLLIVWFGIGDATKIWLLFLAAFPPITISTVQGIEGVNRDRVNAALSLGASRVQAVLHVVLPSALPSIMNGIRIATGFAWTTVVAAELNNGIPGIGALAYLSGTQLDTPLTIACIIVIGVAAVLLDWLIRAITRLIIPWEGKD
ncbi:ABC transporter permease [Bifidobacterium phasiani]|uniref:ABC transporter permease n=1 Tax=Bifidobacterium phasiani TaxID=2834431 RepID=A0ABS6W759_9BIFI|nr:ABC transporter permease [Bifidobacterium phasiani]MBW3082338.1 ABC transporter permease [Bifidobacterium phasiani]